MSREQIWELEENKRSLLRQAYRMKQECPHMSPVGLEYEMYAAIMKEVREDYGEITAVCRGLGWRYKRKSI